MKNKKRPGTPGIKPFGSTKRVASGEKKIFQRAQSNFGVKIYPSSQQKIKSWVQKGVTAGTIKSTDEIKIAIAAITAATIKDAKANKRGVVKPKNVISVWQSDLKMGSQKCPPHLCLRRSIISRTEDVKNKFPGIDDLLGNE